MLKPIMDESWTQADREAYFSLLERRSREKKIAWGRFIAFFAIAVFIIWSEEWIVQHWLIAAVGALWLLLCWLAVILIEMAT